MTTAIKITFHFQPTLTSWARMTYTLLMRTFASVSYVTHIVDCRDYARRRQRYEVAINALICINRNNMLLPCFERTIYHSVRVTLAIITIKRWIYRHCAVYSAAPVVVCQIELECGALHDIIIKPWALYIGILRAQWN